MDIYEIFDHYTDSIKQSFNIDDPTSEHNTSLEHFMNALKQVCGSNDSLKTYIVGNLVDDDSSLNIIDKLIVANRLIAENEFCDFELKKLIYQDGFNKITVDLGVYDSEGEEKGIKKEPI